MRIDMADTVNTMDPPALSGLHERMVLALAKASEAFHLIAENKEICQQRRGRHEKPRPEVVATTRAVNEALKLLAEVLTRRDVTGA